MKALQFLFNILLFRYTLAQDETTAVESTTNEPSRCTYANNTIGTCGCSQQLFIGEGCTKGFFCMTAEDFPNPEDGQMYEGCEIKCADDEILLADPRNGGSWNCAPGISQVDTKIVLCPGKFNTECVCSDGLEACPIGDCECDSQLRVNHDCTYAKFCNSSLPTGFEEITCPDDKIVIVNLLNHFWFCGRDDGRCPGAFHVGCQEEFTEEPEKTTEPAVQTSTEIADTTTRDDTMTCHPSNNTLGSCQFDGQLFIGEDCTKGFVCEEGATPDGPYDGCDITCEEGQQLLVDTRNGGAWWCIRAESVYCPGKFNTELACEGGPDECPIGECQCGNQFRVSHDCKTAKYCNEDMSGFKDITCAEPDEIVYVQMNSHVWRCAKDDGRCPGAFHVGCEDEVTEEPATTTEIAETTTEATITCHQSNNTLGTCNCDGQLFIGEDCRQGFVCKEGTSLDGPYDGCDITCDEGQQLLVDTRNGGGWWCIKAGPVYCPGNFNTECACEGGPDECPIGECECGNQFRVSHDCKTAKYCNEDMSGFKDITCAEPDEIVYIDIDRHTWRCSGDDGRCPGAFHVGCQDGVTEEPITTTEIADTTTEATMTCHQSNNTLGTCDCDKQLFIGEDCSKGFYCMGGTSEAGPYEGCDISCDKGDMLLVDPRNGGNWRCMRAGPYFCPGTFNTECACEGGPAECPIGECECASQLRVGHDCKTAKYCNEDMDGFQNISCDLPDQIVYVDLVKHTWRCAGDDGRCPGAFHVGCQDDSTEEPTEEPTIEPTVEPTTTLPESRCTFGNNTLGKCGCGKQLFVADDCLKGFYCMDAEEFPEEEDPNMYDGCAIQCASDEFLYVDPRLGGSWRCNKKFGPMPTICPGKFNTECGCNDGPDDCPIGDCECDGQLRVAHDCKTARYCNGTIAEGFEEISCSDNELVYVNLITHDWRCGMDDGRCPGAFHVGCQDDGAGTTTTTATTTTTTTTISSTTATISPTTATITTTMDPDNSTGRLGTASCLLAFMLFIIKLSN